MVKRYDTRRPIIQPVPGGRQRSAGLYMSNGNDTQTRRAAGNPAAEVSDAPAQDMLWRRFDALLQEFLTMEKTSPAVDQHRAASDK